MGDESRDPVQGTLDVFDLKTLALEPMHSASIPSWPCVTSDGLCL
jgi:hypothetical protein